MVNDSYIRNCPPNCIIRIFEPPTVTTFLMKGRIMKKLLVILSFFAMASAAGAEVSRRVCMADGNTPLELADPNVPLVYRDIMVGTQLTIIISSDAGGYWFGDLSIEGDDRNYGLLSARDYNDSTADYEGSRFPAAGELARVWDWTQSGIAGFSFSGDDNAIPGDWFIIDYNATDSGDCTVKFYESLVHDPDRDTHFTHVVTRDLNNDAIVNFVDFEIFASYWQATGCAGPSWCAGADLDTSTNVDGNDLELFLDFWLERTNASWF